MKRIAIATLGCKANQFDSHSIESQLRGHSTLVDFQDQADVYIVNTCSVTHRGDADARNLIRRAKRQNPAAKIVVTGCYAQTQPEAVAKLGVDVVLGNSHKDRVAEVALADNAAQTQPHIDVSELAYHHGMPVLPLVEQRSGQSRAFVKIQDGCDYSCSFCITTIARGASRSLPLGQIIEQIKKYEELGYQEVVLTGVQIGHFGRDLVPKMSLVQALEIILEKTLVPRLRLTSIDPREITSQLIDLVAKQGRLCPHLHIPVQSGDDAILLLMKRNYDRAYLRDLFAEIKVKIPDCLIGSDLIVGFPGEGPSEFDFTVDALEQWIDHAHVFSYSDRPGTKAANAEDKVSAAVIRRRAQVLRELAERKYQQFQQALVGKVEAVLLENTLLASGRFGYTKHYAPVVVDANFEPGQIVQCQLQWEAKQLIGLVNAPVGSRR